MKFTKKNGGFTLVELIVVIAILAILAAIAVPAYSGYISKANEAADQQLLASVNTAFAAACLENNVDMLSVKSASIGLENGKIAQDANGNFTGLSAVQTDSTTISAAEMNEDFGAYFDGNEGVAFKTFNGPLVIDPDTGTLKDIEDLASEGKEFSVVYKGNAITVSAQAVMNLQNSTFGQEIGAEALLTEVAGLTNMVGTGDIDLETMLDDEAYMRSLASYIGIENADTMDMTALNAAIDTKTEKLTDTQASNMMLNGLVYYAAEKTTQMDAADITTFLTSGNVAGNLGSDQATKLANASMAYGMYTAFVNSDQYTGEKTSTTSDPMAALQTISGSSEYSEAFTNYVKSAEGQADLQAYMSAMSVINDSTGNDATLDVLGNGFDDSELVDLMAQFIGS